MVCRWPPARCCFEETWPRLTMTAAWLIVELGGSERVLKIFSPSLVRSTFLAVSLGEYLLATSTV